MSLAIQKYGGSSVASLDHIQKVAQHITSTVAAGEHVVVTVSAMGEKTDELKEMAVTLSQSPPRRELDMLLSAGERISSSLLSIALQKEGIGAVSLTGSQCGILTDESHGNARIRTILGDRVREALAHNRVVIVAGFQGVSPSTKDITTLGRGGSDLTAVAMMHTLGASRCELYKDVEGVHTADPRIVPAATRLETISWSQLASLSWHGAQIVHPRSIHVAKKNQLPIWIRSSFNLAAKGTYVTASGANSPAVMLKESTMESPTVTALTHKAAITLLSIPINMGPTLGKAREWLWEQGESPLFDTFFTTGRGGEIQTAIPTSLVEGYCQQVGSSPRERREVGTITLVGDGFKQSPELSHFIQSQLGSACLFFDVRESTITIAVPPDQVTEIVKTLHRDLIENKSWCHAKPEGSS